MMYLDVGFFKSTMGIRVCWAFWIYIYVFHQNGILKKNIISFNIFVGSNLFCFFWDFSDTNVRFLI